MLHRNICKRRQHGKVDGSSWRGVVVGRLIYRGDIQGVVAYLYLRRFLFKRGGEWFFIMRNIPYCCGNMGWMWRILILHEIGEKMFSQCLPEAHTTYYRMLFMEDVVHGGFEILKTTEEI